VSTAEGLLSSFLFNVCPRHFCFLVFDGCHAGSRSVFFMLHALWLHRWSCWMCTSREHWSSGDRELTLFPRHRRQHPLSITFKLNNIHTFATPYYVFSVSRGNTSMCRSDAFLFAVGIRTCELEKISNPRKFTNNFDNYCASAACRSVYIRVLLSAVLAFFCAARKQLKFITSKYPFLSPAKLHKMKKRNVVANICCR